MQHLLPLYLIVSILPGIAALSLLWTLAARFRMKGLYYYLISYGCFTVSILINLIMFYLGINISNEISFGVFMLMYMSIPFSVCMHITLALAVNEATMPPPKKILDGSLLFIGIVELVLYATPLLMEYSRENQTINFGPIFPYSGIIEMICISYAILLSILLRRNIPNPTIRKYILILFIIVAVFLPAIGYDQFFFSGVTTLTSVPITVILSPLLYVAISVATLIFGSKLITYPQSEVSVASEKKVLDNAGLQDIETVPATRVYAENQRNFTENGNKVASDSPGEAAGSITENPPEQNLEHKILQLAQRAGLSEREKMIIPLICKGLGNKQIALELNISTKTVGNHMYNIYRKLNITSRYELLALLS